MLKFLFDLIVTLVVGTISLTITLLSGGALFIFLFIGTVFFML